MKKVLSVVLTALLLFSFAACDTADSESLYVTEENPSEDTVAEEIDYDWGIELSVNNADSKGLSLTIGHSDVEINGELSTGSPYWIELYTDGQWESIEEAPSEHERAWTAEAYIIPMNGSTDFDINWEWLYGELPSGHYRIGKTINVSYNAGNRDHQTLYAEFDIQ